MKRTEIIFLKLGLVSLADLISEVEVYTSCLVLADENTARHCYPKVKRHLPPHTLFIIPAGEQDKTLATCQHVWQELSMHQADRKSLLICLGGGVVTDLGGFCASAYKRGIDAIYIPTTLMAMADAAIGGKTGIDFQDFKNAIGSFTNPRAVYIFPNFLETLSQEELLSGYAEVVKHALLQGGDSWQAVLARGNQIKETIALVEMIEDSVAYKLSIVNQDPYEANLRKILNLGHTVGHAIESWKLKQGEPVPHGFAVAAGLVIEGYIALKKHLLPAPEFDIIARTIKYLFPETKLNPADKKAIALLTLQDKKNAGGSINAVLLKGIGNPQYNVAISIEDIEAGLNWYISEF